MLLEVTTLTQGSNIPSSMDSVFLSQATLESCGFQEGQQISVWIGVNEHTLKVSKLTGAVDNQLLIPEPQYQTLNLPRVHKLSALAEPNEGTIRIGPFLGFLVVRKRNSKIPPYTSQKSILETFSITALSKGLVPFVFSPQDVDWEKKKIKGFTVERLHNNTLQWVSQNFPLPNVVFNRILNRSTEKRESVKNSVRLLNKTPHLHHFNPRFLQKWETHEILHKCPFVAPFLPETVRVRQLSDIAAIAAKHPVIYIKPINGSLGTNIVKLEATTEGFRYQYRRRKRNHSGVWKNPQTLWTELGAILGRRQYIAQQGLEFKTYKGRVFDIRLLIQKNAHGDWITTATVGRVAAENSIFPNIAAGGVARRIEDIWQEIAREKWEDSSVCKQVLSIGLYTAYALERSLGTFGELGLDIGIDTNSRAWLIEVNSKPSRKVFPKECPHLKNNSIHYIIDYSKYISGFTLADQETGEVNENSAHSR